MCASKPRGLIYPVIPSLSPYPPPCSPAPLSRSPTPVSLPTSGLQRTDSLLQTESF